MRAKSTYTRGAVAILFALGNGVWLCSLVDGLNEVFRQVHGRLGLVENGAGRHDGVGGGKEREGSSAMRERSLNSSEHNTKHAIGRMDGAEQSCTQDNQGPTLGGQVEGRRGAPCFRLQWPCQWGRHEPYQP